MLKLFSRKRVLLGVGAGVLLAIALLLQHAGWEPPFLLIIIFFVVIWWFSIVAGPRRRD